MLEKDNTTQKMQLLNESVYYETRRALCEKV